MKPVQTECLEVPQGTEVSMEGFFSDAFRALKSFIAGDAKIPDSHKRKNTAFAGASKVKQLVDELKKTYADPKWVADRVVDGSFKDDGTVSVFSHNGKMIDKPVAAVEKAFIEISRLDATITAAFKSWSTQAAKIYSKIDNIPMSAEGKESLWISVDKELSAWVEKFPKLNYRIDGLPGDPDLHTQAKSDYVLDGRFGGLHWKFTSAPKGMEIRRLSAEEIHQAALLIIQIVQAVEHMGGNEKGSWNFEDVKYNSAFDVQEVYGAVTDKHSMYWIIGEGYYQGYFIPDKFRMEYLFILHEYARRLENWIFRSIRGTEGKKNQVASEAVSDAVPAVALEDVENGKIFKEHEHEIYVLLDDFEQLKGAKSVDRQEQWTLKVAKTDKNGARGNIRIRKITKRPAYGEEATGDVEVQYVYNIKANMADGSRLEVPLPASEDSFKVFQALAENGMIKDRYHFPDEESGLVFEVDMFLDEDGNYHPWAKIDIEVKDINAEIPPLPIVVKDKIMGDSKDPADKERITELYDRYFLTPSPYTKKTGSAVAMEGFLSGIVDWFKSHSKDRKKSGPVEENLYEWMVHNVYVHGGKLRPGLKIIQGSVSSGSNPVFRRGNATISGVDELVAEFQKDLEHYNQLFSRHESAMSKAALVSKDFRAQMRKVNDEIIDADVMDIDAGEVIKKAVMKFKGRLPPSISESFSDSNYTYLGGYSEGYVHIENGVKKFRTKDGKMGQSAQFTIPNMEQSSMDKLLELSKKLGELSSKAYKLAGESYGYDGSDPPFRGYSELWDDKSFAEVVNPLMHSDFEDHYIQLADLIYERVARLEEAVWKIIRRSVTE